MPPQKPSIDLNDTPTRITVAIVLGLIFLGGWWLIARNSMKTEASPDTKKVSEMTPEQQTPVTGSVLGPIANDTPIIAGSNESIDVSDQAPGMSVMVKEATLAQVSWIAVRDGSGRTLGAGRFESGSFMNAEVPLLRATEAGQSYQVLIYVDDGNKEFDLHDDILVTRSDGSVVGDVFSAR